MSLQYIKDSNGQTTGVFIPIKEWEKLKSKYKDIDESTVEIPEWQMNEVRERLAEYKKNPKSGLDFNESMDDIEKNFLCSN